MNTTSQLKRAVYDTISYFDVFDMPLTSVQVWQYLISERSCTLHDIEEALRRHPALDTLRGYYFLSGRSHLVRTRLDRHSIAQEKWKIAVGAGRWLGAVPFVRGLAGSGSLAIDNTKGGSDLDVFVITARRRIWTTRLAVLLVSQLLGRRRKYWNMQAPDKLCVNHYVTEDSLGIPGEIQNVYTAQLYTALVPLYGSKVVRSFQDANMSWMRTYVSSPSLPDVSHQYTVRIPWVARFVKRALEGLLYEPIGNGVEKWAERIQRFAIDRHHKRHQHGRVAVSDRELAFHPDTKVPSILRRFERARFS